MTEIDALQTMLAGEHAALFLYGALGAQTSESATPLLFAAVESNYRRHRAQRDQLSMMLRDAGADPVTAAPVYDVPAHRPTPEAVMRVALDAESTCAANAAFLVANSTGESRLWAIGALTASAIAELDLGAGAGPFPGADDLLTR